LNTAENIIPEDWPTVQKSGVVVGTTYHEVGLENFGSVVAKIKAENPEVIYSTSFGNDVGNLVKALRQGGVDVPVMLNEYTPQACEIAEAEFTDIYVANEFFDPKGGNPLSQYFVKTYEEKYGEEPEFYAANYYENGFTLWELVKKVIAEGGDPTSGEALNAALEAQNDFKSLYGGTPKEVGQIKFNLEQHTVVKPLRVATADHCETKEVAVLQEVEPGGNPEEGLVEIIGQ
jgi:branched-chain amino acid transport system substrate-binding protein